MKFEKTIIVVTGGTKGIGKACVNHFLKEGACVAVWDLEVSEDEDRRLREGARLLPVRVDVSDEEAVRQAAAATVRQWGAVHHLVQSAGIQGAYRSATEISTEEWNRVLGVNLFGQLLGAKYLIPTIRESGGGCIVNIASVNALHCQPTTVAYATSKAAILGLTRSIAVDYGPEVRCVAVCPGAVDTPMLRNAMASIENADEAMEDLKNLHLSKRLGKPEEVAGLVGYLCSPEGAFITGHEVRIDGGLGIRQSGN